MIAAVGTTNKESGAASTPSVAAPEKRCSARKAVRYYQRRYNEWRSKMGVGVREPGLGTRHRQTRPGSCPRYLASVWQRRAAMARRQYHLWYAYHWDWPSWLPDKWQRIGACETGYGERPGNWRHYNSTYQGAFGFHHQSWDAFVPRADPKAGPYPRDAHLATPRQQYEVALAIYRMFGLSGWGCRGA